MSNARAYYSTITATKYKHNRNKKAVLSPGNSATLQYLTANYAAMTEEFRLTVRDHGEGTHKLQTNNTTLAKV